MEAHRQTPHLRVFAHEAFDLLVIDDHGVMPTAIFAAFALVRTAAIARNLSADELVRRAIERRAVGADRVFTLYPSTDIRWNFGDAVTGQTGRLFLPFDVRIGKKFSDLFNASLEVGVPTIKQYPIYNFMTVLRFNLTS
jgi:hypothetical protein